MARAAITRRIGRRFHWLTFAIGVAVTAAFIALSAFYPNLLVTLELKVSDARMRARRARPFSGQVVIVAIDDKSIGEIGHWPWSRAVMANLQRGLTDYKAKVVAYDLLFTETDSADVERDAISERLRALNLSSEQIQATLGTNNDAQFADAIRAQGSTLLGYSFAPHMIGPPPDKIDPDYVSELSKPFPLSWTARTDPGAAPNLIGANAYRPPIPVLNQAAKKTGFVDADSDQDGLFRNELIAIKFHGQYYAPLFVAAVWAFEDYPQRVLDIGEFGIKDALVGDTTIPVEELGRMVVTFRGPAGTIAHVSATDVINHRVTPDRLAGKIALVGVTGQGLGDRAVTPAGYEFPRVEIHANAIETVLSRDFIYRSKTYTLVLERLYAALLGLGVSIVTAWLSATWSVAAMVVLAASYFGFAQFMLSERGVMIGVVLPLIITGSTVIILLGYRYITEGREKGHLRHVFEHYLHPEIIASVVDDPKGLKLGGERRHLAILFADIVGFTSRAEKSDPAQLVAMLNVYMTRMTDIILENGGVVDKLMGDGIMAFWGAPNRTENPSRGAIEAALEMLAALEDLRRTDSRFEDLHIGIGISSGDAIVGNFGGERRFDYSAIGDTVNFASRLEGLTRKFGTHLLVNRATFVEAANSYVARDIGLVKVKGKAELVPVVEIASHANGAIDPAFYDLFGRVVELLRAGEADRARDLLERLMAAHPEDEVISLYLQKLGDASGSPPREMIFEFETK